MERMGDEKLAKKSDTQKVKRKRRHGRPRIRWEDCVKRDLERVGGEWRTAAKDRVGDVDREHRERSEERKEKNLMVTMATSPLMTGMARGEQRLFI